MGAHAGPTSPAPPDVAWDWSAVARGLAYALPAAIVAATNPEHGIPLALGVLPAAIAGLPPARRRRIVIAAFGFLIGLPIFVGTVLAGAPVAAVAAVFLLGVGSVWVARQRPRLGMIAMTLGLPMIGVGLSYDDIGKGAAIAGLMIAGSVYACLVAMLWPEKPAPPAPAQPPPPSLDYGVRLGAAGAVCAAIGFAAGLDHVGWATAACLLVMRPAADMQRLRSAGRLAAVAAGAVAAVGFIALEPVDAWYSVAVLVAVAGAAATHGSRWYVTAAFTTYLVFLLLLYAAPDDAAHRLGERVGETALGVAVAYLFGLLLPTLRARREPVAS